MQFLYKPSLIHFPEFVSVPYRKEYIIIFSVYSVLISVEEFLRNWSSKFDKGMVWGIIPF